MNATAETYEDVEKMLGKIVAGFLRKNGGGECDGLATFEDAMSVAKIAFAGAYADWDADRSKFSTHAWNRVWQALATAKRTAMQKRKMPPKPTVHFSGMKRTDFATRQPGLMERAFRDASEDATTIIELLVEAPAEAVECWIGCHGRVLKSKRAEVRQHARKQGWSHRRFWRAWWEVAELVCS